MLPKLRTNTLFYFGAAIFFFISIILAKLYPPINILPLWVNYAFLLFSFGCGLLFYFSSKNPARRKSLDKKFQEYNDEKLIKLNNWIILVIIFILTISYTIFAYYNNTPPLRILLNALIAVFIFNIIQNWKKLNNEAKLLKNLIFKRKK